MLSGTQGRQHVKTGAVASKLGQWRSYGLPCHSEDAPWKLCHSFETVASQHGCDIVKMLLMQQEESFLFLGRLSQTKNMSKMSKLTVAV